VDNSPLRDSFLNPATARQRQDEALRSVFVDGLAQQEAAQRFHLSYQAFRQLVHSFRQALATGAPPFSTDPVEADPPRGRHPAPRKPAPPGQPKQPKPPTWPP
jgi:hypothetical protein